MIKLTASLLLGALLTVLLATTGVAKAAFVPGTPAAATTTPATSSATAANDAITPGQLPGSSLSATSLVDLIFSWIPTILALTAFIGLVVGGFLYMTAGGDPAKAEKARKSLVWSITGLVLAILSFVIIKIVAGSASNLTIPK